MHQLKEIQFDIRGKKVEKKKKNTDCIKCNTAKQADL